MKKLVLIFFSKAVFAQALAVGRYTFYVSTPTADYGNN
jgi:hypothetical protein